MRFHYTSILKFFSLVIIVPALLLMVFFLQQQQQTQLHAAGRKAYYVSPSGTDSNPGTQTAPFATINKAASIATPGTRVHVLPGTYTQPVATTVSGTVSARIVYVSDVKWGAKIRTTGANTIWENHASYIDIIGFDISGDGAFGIENNGSFVSTIGNRIHDIPATHCSKRNGGAGIDDGNSTAQGDDDIGNIVFNIPHSAVSAGGIIDFLVEWPQEV